MMAGLVLFFIAGETSRAQAPIAPPVPGTAFSPDQLDQLVGPIALYPDPLTAEILPAATFPSEIVEADQYLSQGGDPNQIPAQGWDPSVQALAHYPNVLKWMAENLAWTTQLGQAFQIQQADVMTSMQRLRAKAQSLGNLPSTPQESVVTDDGEIEIEPTNPDEMYVPVYQPNVIFYQPGVFCAFPFWLPLGIWLGHDWDWHHHGLFFWGPGHERPGNWWHESPRERHAYVAGHSLPTWHAGRSVAARAPGGWQRGYEAAPAFRSRGPVMPRQAGPEATVNHSAPAFHGTAAPPVEHHEAVRPAAPPVERHEAVRPTAPPVERHETVRPTAPPVERHETVRPTAPPVERHEAVRSAPSGGLFGGGQSGREAVESSVRGQASRATMGGGSMPHGGGAAPAGGGAVGGSGGGGGGKHH